MTKERFFEMWRVLEAFNTKHGHLTILGYDLEHMDRKGILKPCELDTVPAKDAHQRYQKWVDLVRKETDLSVRELKEWASWYNVEMSNRNTPI